MGSLVAALASYLDARSAGGRWLVRIEDLDPPRETPRATSEILHALDVLGLHWDGKVLYQSQRHQAYEDALLDLRESGLLFPCTCSRQQIQDAGGIYPGLCREKSLAASDSSDGIPCALRLRVRQVAIDYNDMFQGRRHSKLARESGDFVVKRKDGFYAYQLAVVVDDAYQKITHVVRGIDLIDSTPRHLYLQSLLGYPSPCYGHIPIIVNREGQKLSKQHFAAPLNLDRPAASLIDALEYLQQQPDPRLAGVSPESVLDWAIANWRPRHLHGLRQLREKAGSLQAG